MGTSTPDQKSCFLFLFSASSQLFRTRQAYGFKFSKPTAILTILRGLSKDRGLLKGKTRKCKLGANLLSWQQEVSGNKHSGSLVLMVRQGHDKHLRANQRRRRQYGNTYKQTRHHPTWWQPICAIIHGIPQHIKKNQQTFPRTSFFVLCTYFVSIIKAPAMQVQVLKPVCYCKEKKWGRSSMVSRHVALDSSLCHVHLLPGCFGVAIQPTPSISQCKREKKKKKGGNKYSHKRKDTPPTQQVCPSRQIWIKPKGNKNTIKSLCLGIPPYRWLMHFCHPIRCSSQSIPRNQPTSSKNLGLHGIQN